MNCSSQLLPSGMALCHVLCESHRYRDLCSCLVWEVLCLNWYLSQQAARRTTDPHTQLCSVGREACSYTAFPKPLLPLKQLCLCVSVYVCVWGLNGQWSVTDRQALTLWGPLCPAATLSSDRQRGRKTVTDTEKWLFFLNELLLSLGGGFHWEGEKEGGGWMRRWRDQRTKKKKNWKELFNDEGTDVRYLTHLHLLTNYFEKVMYCAKVGWDIFCHEWGCGCICLLICWQRSDGHRTTISSG